MIKILAFGTFDKLHQGHINFLKQAKKKGDRLYVVLARDVNIKKIKGHWPKDNEKKRIKKLQKTKIADVVLLGYKQYKNRTKIIKKIKPHVICLGYDQPKLKLKNKKIKIIRLHPYQPKKYKSSLLP